MSTWFSDAHTVSAGMQSALFMIKGYTPRLQFERFDDGNGIIVAPVRPSQCQKNVLRCPSATQAHINKHWAQTKRGHYSASERRVLACNFQRI
jgi:hypothetical protein